MTMSMNRPAAPTRNLHEASRQWMSRPADQRFTSLTDLQAFKKKMREASSAKIVANRKLSFAPATSDLRAGLEVFGPNGVPFVTTHHSFGQIANLAGAPGGYLRSLPAPIAADCLNYGLRFNRSVEEVGVLLTKLDNNELRAATGPNYGRIWDADLVDAMVDRFGDGVTGDWKVPGEFGKDVTVTSANTTLFASDRDMFVFLADEKNRIELPNRRAQMMGTFARGFFVWNSEVGASTLGASFFLFDYTCCNRIVWNVEHFREVRIRHTSGAPSRWLEEVEPVLIEYAAASEKPVIDAIEAQRKAKIDDIDEFLANRFTKKESVAIQAAHVADEGRPIETRWDAITGITAYARSVPNNNDRVQLERKAGDLLAA